MGRGWRGGLGLGRLPCHSRAGSPQLVCLCLELGYSECVLPLPVSFHFFPQESAHRFQNENEFNLVYENL